MAALIVDIVDGDGGMYVWGWGGWMGKVKMRIYTHCVQEGSHFASSVFRSLSIPSGY